MATWQSDELQVQTPDNLILDLPIAGLGSRLLAQVVDLSILSILLIITLLGLMSVLSAVFPSVDSSVVLRIASGVTILVFILIFVLAEAVSAGRTPGKTLLGLRVVRLDGSSIGFVESLARNSARLIDYLFGLGAVVMFFQPQCQRIGDLLAGTLVIRERSSLSTAQPWMETAIQLRSSDPGNAISGIDRLTARERSALRTFLAKPNVHPAMRQRIAATFVGRLQELLQLPEDAAERQEPPEAFLERLYLQIEQQH